MRWSVTRDKGDVRLLRRAEADLLAIARFTLSRFGVEQSRRYRDGLLASIDALAQHPLMGTDLGHIRRNLRRHIWQEHSIYYRATGHGVVIQRILGPGQDPLRHIPNREVNQ